MIILIFVTIYHKNRHAPTKRAVERSAINTKESVSDMNGNTPIILCEGSGIIRLKNNAAVKLMPRPKRGANIKKLLDEYNMKAFDELYDNPDAERDNYGIIRIEALSSYSRALAGTYLLDGKRCIMLIFFRLLQTSEITQFSQRMDMLVLSNAADIFTVIDESVFTKASDEGDIARREEQLDRFMINVSEKLFGGDRISRRFGLYKTINIIRNNLIGFGKSLGYNIDYFCASIDERNNFRTDYSAMTIAQTALAAFALTLSKSGSIICGADERYGYLHFIVKTTLANPRFLCLNSHNVLKLARYCGYDLFNIKFLLILYKELNYILTYSLTEK